MFKDSRCIDGQQNTCDIKPEVLPGMECQPVMECPCERVCHREICHHVPHVVPINTKIVNHHIYKHTYSPCYTCCEENEISNIYERKCGM